MELELLKNFINKEEYRNLCKELSISLFLLANNEDLDLAELKFMCGKLSDRLAFEGRIYEG